MAHSKKETDNTTVKEIQPLSNPATRSIVDRYILASDWCQDKTVLDAAGGYGMGSVILYALGADRVTSVDVDADAVNYHHDNYQLGQFSHHGIQDTEIFNRVVEARYEDITSEEFGQTLPLDEYEVIVSLETFEHVEREQVEQMLTNFKEWCKDSGTILISTPIRKTKEFNYSGGTHLWEYNYKELVEELTKVWEPDDFIIHSLTEKWMGKDNFITEYNEAYKPEADLFFVEIHNE